MPQLSIMSNECSSYWNVVYMATCTANGKSYVGQTIQGLDTRRKDHLRSARNAKSFLFAKALSKYGEAAFEWSILWTVTDEELEAHPLLLDELEEMTISVNNTLMPHGYNMLAGPRDTNRKRKREEDRDVPKYIHRTTNGYEATYRRHNKQVSHPSLTKEEKLQILTVWLERIKKGERLEKHVRSRKNREDNDLPKYIHSMPGGFIARYEGKSKTTVGEQRTKDEKLKILQDWLIQVQAGEQPQKRLLPRKNKEDAGLPKYIRSIKNGYAVHKNVAGVSKTFNRQTMSMSDKLEAAKEFVAVHTS